MNFMKTIVGICLFLLAGFFLRASTTESIAFLSWFYGFLGAVQFFVVAPFTVAWLSDNLKDAS